MDVHAVATPPAFSPAHLAARLTVLNEEGILGGNWLTDSVINTGQELIQQAYPHVQELQDVSLGHTLAFAVEKGEFIHVLHNGHDHWVAYTIGCGPAEVEIF